MRDPSREEWSCLSWRRGVFGVLGTGGVLGRRIVSVEDDDDELGGPPGAPVAILRGVVGCWCGGGSRAKGLLVEGWFSRSSQLTRPPAVLLGGEGAGGAAGAAGATGIVRGMVSRTHGLPRARTSSARATGDSVLRVERCSLAGCSGEFVCRFATHSRTPSRWASMS